jgi:hypothetical protein
MPGSSLCRLTHTRQLVGESEHRQHDTFVARWRDRTLDADAFVTFSLGSDGVDRSGEEDAGLPADGLQLRLSGSDAGAR